MPGRQAGSTVSVYARVMPRAQNRVEKGSILMEDEILFQSGYTIYLWLALFSSSAYANKNGAVSKLYKKTISVGVARMKKISL